MVTGGCFKGVWKLLTPLRNFWSHIVIPWLLYIITCDKGHEVFMSLKNVLSASIMEMLLLSHRILDCFGMFYLLMVMISRTTFVFCFCALGQYLLQSHSKVLMRKSKMLNIIKFLIDHNGWYQAAGVPFSKANMLALFHSSDEHLDFGLLHHKNCRKWICLYILK